MATGEQLLAGVRVLVVDDNADQLNILGSVLRGAGALVTIAFDAQEAFDTFQADPPDLIVSDLAMPYATGYTLIRRIRTLPKGCAVPAIAITSFLFEEHRVKAVEAGFNDWLPKPVHDSLVPTASRLLGRRAC